MVGGRNKGCACQRPEPLHMKGCRVTKATLKAKTRTGRHKYLGILAKLFPLKTIIPWCEHASLSCLGWSVLGKQRGSEQIATMNGRGPMNELLAPT